MLRELRLWLSVLLLFTLVYTACGWLNSIDLDFGVLDNPNWVELSDSTE